MKFQITRPLLYLVLFSIYAPLVLLSSNLAETSPEVIIRPLLNCLLFGALTFLVFWTIIRNIAKTCMVASIFLILFYSYGHVYTLLKGIDILGLAIGKNRFLLPIFGLATIFLVILGLRWKKPPESIHTFMLIVGLALVVVPLFNIGRSIVIEAINRKTEIENRMAISQSVQVPVGTVVPDIYYIILDSYTRADALKTDLKYDDSAFIEELKKIGFIVADCSRSNYSATLFSMSSTLNMDYLDKLNPDLLDPNGKPPMLVALFRNSRVRTEFAKYGYQWIAIDPGRKGLEMDNADLFVQPKNITKYLAFRVVINDFEDMLLRTTPGIVLVNFGNQLFGGVYSELRFPYYERAAYQLFDLDILPTIPDLPGPKFVYTHFMLPHYPYMFTADGSIQTDPDYLNDPIPEKKAIEGYTAQVTFINSRILPVIKTIISKSKTPPIIILQGDHGMDGDNRLKILNAYYLPDSLKDQIYPTITPVNTFRLILNGLFNRGLPLLDDKSFSVTQKYTFTEVREDNPVCIGN